MTLLVSINKDIFFLHIELLIEIVYFSEKLDKFFGNVAEIKINYIVSMNLLGFELIAGACLQKKE